MNNLLLALYKACPSQIQKIIRLIITVVLMVTYYSRFLSLFHMICCGILIINDHG